VKLACLCIGGVTGTCPGGGLLIFKGMGGCGGDGIAMFREFAEGVDLLNMERTRDIVFRR